MSFVDKTDNTDTNSNKLFLDTYDSIPSEVKAIIDNKCYGCHNSESKNMKGRKKLSFDKLDKMSTYKQIGKYEGIHETISESKMPPKKFLAKYPNKALTSDEKETLISWAAKKGEELAK